MPEIRDEQDHAVVIGSIVNTEAEFDFEKLSKEERAKIVQRWNFAPGTESTRERLLADTYTRMPDGVVVQISDWEGDVDDEGRSYTIMPRVGVKWPDYDQIDWYETGIDSLNYPDDPDLIVSDLIVVGQREPDSAELERESDPAGKCQ
jgi:hypothetical protein